MPTPSPFDVIPRVLGDWGSKQKARLKKAHSLSGHQNRGGRRWRNLNSGLPSHLFKTGRMRASYFRKVSGLKVIVGNNVKYAVYHQYGTSRLPVRKMVVATKSDIGKLKKQIKNAVEARMRGK